MDKHEEKHLRDPEDRATDNCSEQQRKDKAMDKTLADTTSRDLRRRVNGSQ